MVVNLSMLTGWEYHSIIMSLHKQATPKKMEEQIRHTFVLSAILFTCVNFTMLSVPVQLTSLVHCKQYGLINVSFDIF
jgi:hypothetical protein